MTALCSFDHFSNNECFCTPRVHAFEAKQTETFPLLNFDLRTHSFSLFKCRIRIEMHRKANRVLNVSTERILIGPKWQHKMVQLFRSESIKTKPTKPASLVLDWLVPGSWDQRAIHASLAQRRELLIQSINQWLPENVAEERKRGSSIVFLPMNFDCRCHYKLKSKFVNRRRSSSQNRSKNFQLTRSETSPELTATNDDDNWKQMLKNSTEKKNPEYPKASMFSLLADFSPFGVQLNWILLDAASSSFPFFSKKKIVTNSWWDQQRRHASKTNLMIRVFAAE